MNWLTPDQIEDVVSLKHVVRQFDADLVIIGAMAYRAFVPDELRFTEDIDVAIALDLDNLDSLRSALTAAGWVGDATQEQRWWGPRKSRMDLLPAGPSLRASRRLTWPRSGMVMSLLGFGHVFDRSVEMEVGTRGRVLVAPLDVLFLLKVVSYLDAPQRRTKDTGDIHRLLRIYEADSERIYSDAVLNADLSDVEFAPSFLLGIDLARLCDTEEHALVKRFLSMAVDRSSPEFALLLQHEGPLEPSEERLSLRLGAFCKGLNQSERCD